MRQEEGKRDSSRDGSSLLPTLTLTLAEAEKHTGLSRAYLDKQVQAGLLVLCPHGRRGAYVVKRDQLEALVQRAFGTPANSIEEDFSFA